MAGKNGNKAIINSGGGAYFLGMIGAAVYYLSISHGLGSAIVALLKALVWPAFMVHDVLRFIA